jgi:hypothetical protein
MKSSSNRSRSSSSGSSSSSSSSGSDSGNSRVRSGSAQAAACSPRAASTFAAADLTNGHKAVGSWEVSRAASSVSFPAWSSPLYTRHSAPAARFRV